MGKVNKLVLASCALALTCIAKILVLGRLQTPEDPQTELSSNYDFKKTFIRAGFVTPRRAVRGSVFDGLDDGVGRLPGVNVQAWAAMKNGDGVTFSKNLKHSKVQLHSRNIVNHPKGKINSLTSTHPQQASKQMTSISHDSSEAQKEAALNAQLTARLNKIRAELNIANSPRPNSENQHDKEFQEQVNLNAQLRAELQDAESAIASVEKSGIAKELKNGDHSSTKFNPFGVLARTPASDDLVDGVLSSPSLAKAPSDGHFKATAVGVLARTVADPVNRDGPLAVSPSQSASRFGLLGRATSTDENDVGALASVPPSVSGKLDRKIDAEAEGSLAEVAGGIVEVGGDLTNVRGEVGGAGGVLAATPGDDMSGGVLSRVRSETAAGGGILARVTPSSQVRAARSVGQRAVDGSLAQANGDDMAKGVLSRMRGGASDSFLDHLGRESAGAVGPDGSLAKSEETPNAIQGSLSAAGGDDMAGGVLNRVHSGSTRDAESDGVLERVRSVASGFGGSLSGFADSAADRDGSLSALQGPPPGGALASLHQEGELATSGVLYQVGGAAALPGGPLSALAQAPGGAFGFLGAVENRAAATNGALAAFPNDAASRDGELSGFAKVRGTRSGGPLAAFADDSAARDGALAGLPGTAAAAGGSLSALESSAADRDGVLAGLRASPTAEAGSLSAVGESRGDRDGSLALEKGSGNNAAGGSLSMLRSGTPMGVLGKVHDGRAAVAGALAAVPPAGGKVGVLGRARTVGNAGGVLASVAAQRRAWVAKQVRLHAVRAAATATASTAGTKTHMLVARQQSSPSVQRWIVKQLRALEVQKAKADADAAADAAAARATATRHQQVEAAAAGNLHRASHPVLAGAAARHGVHTRRAPHHFMQTTDASGPFRQLEEGGEEAVDAEAASDDEGDVGWVKRKWTAVGWTLFAVFGPLATAAVTALVHYCAGPVAAFCTLVIMVAMDICSYYYSWYII